MTIELFIISLAIAFAACFAWAFNQLPRERWQMIAAVPTAKSESGDWRGLNLTFYGFFQATANVFAVATVFVLLGAINIPAAQAFVLISAILVVCWPSSRLIARAVEKKAYTFTIGGAIFVGAIVAPWLIHLINATTPEWLGGRLPVIPSVAAGAIAYAFGEGLGRLACISFGCCYGKNIERLSPRLRRVFESISFRFVGATRKAVYEGGLEGARVVPIQAITSCVMTLIALTGSYLFLNAHYVAALISVVTATQLWRFVSETLRADMRGKAKKITAYQAMALVMIVYVVGVAAFSTVETPPAASIAAGLRSLWDPAVLLFCQALWLGIFLHTGRSMVTGSTLSFFVHKERV
ncbi:MAG TPA: prolipoprotein diacylglyceryl transferase [Blastocatellia bacterium]|nr:prolipoprotein diacylglyceryl transferase [Blastocatellia bacterium]